MCHDRRARHALYGNEWAVGNAPVRGSERASEGDAVAADPRTAAHLRASDAERDAVATALRDHAAAGRLDADELEERLARAFEARTHADLAALTADLPAPAAPPRRERRSLPPVSPVVALAVLMIAIWAVTGAGYFWPMWPIGAMALGAFKHRGHWAARGPQATARP